MSTSLSGLKIVSLLRSSLVIFALLFLANFTTAFAQDRSAASRQSDVNREISRDAVEWADLVRPQPVPDPNLVDTAIVFTNAINRASKVVCVAHDQNGEPVGRVTVRVPPLGLRFIRGTDLSDGKDFIGHARCKGEGSLRISGFLVGRGLTDVPVHQSYERARSIQTADSVDTQGPIVSTRAHIPVVASF